MPTESAASRGYMKTLPRGVMHCPVTPFDNDNKIDYGTLEKLIEFHIRHKTSSICVALHVAESLNLTMQERFEMVEQSVKFTAGRVPVIVHASAAGTDEAIAYARHAEKVGADGICLMTPYYWPNHPEAQYLHFARVFESVRIPAIGYNSPLLQAGVGLPPQTVVRLLNQFDHFIGLKEASHNFETFIELRRAAQAVRPDFSMILGVEYILPSVILGGVGAMSIFAGIAPKLAQNLFDAVERGNLKEALKLQDKAAHFWQILKMEYPAPIKACMEIMGRPVGHTRGPMRTSSPEIVKKLRVELETLGVLDSEPHGWDQ